MERLTSIHLDLPGPVHECGEVLSVFVRYVRGIVDRPSTQIGYDATDFNLTQKIKGSNVRQCQLGRGMDLDAWFGTSRLLFRGDLKELMYTILFAWHNSIKQ